MARFYSTCNRQHKLSTLVMTLSSILLGSSCSAFVARTGITKTFFKPGQDFRAVQTKLEASGSSELFKGGLLADDYSQELAVELASKKLGKVSDLGWKGKEARRQSSIRPKLWPFGGSDELAIQDKANYSLDNPNCPDPWLGLEEFYSIVNDDTAAADLIFVALAGGRAYVERSVAEDVLSTWWGTNGVGDGSRKPKPFQKQQFDRAAFEKTVKTGQRDFIAAWASFIGLTGFAAAGIVFPTNPLSLALVDFIDAVSPPAVPPV
eukprot:CAMPEP_0116127088 /NCGR_PEP_ID=MMETSP0329-20121206/6661_1 /TAXON_ID=697910 /ORGANISM="Pseudo-nitzschia arenysensis, Strain B593" /LENGTH=263 /DNA_ID=CAMNT_0003621179 /DNA_START=139 /DNA_END=930 /DNA_ORIENTATION=-